MKTAEAHPHPRAGESEPQLSPEEFETLLGAYDTKNKLYVPAVRRLVEAGRFDRSALPRLAEVEQSHIDILPYEHNETGERFAHTDVQAGKIVVPDARYVPHEATHLMGGVSWGPLNEGLVQLVANEVTDEAQLGDDKAEKGIYQENLRLARNVARLAGFDLAPGAKHENADWTRFSRIFFGNDREENFNRLNELTRRATGADVLAYMRHHQENLDYMQRAKNKTGNEAWEELKSSERDALEAAEMNGALEALLQHRERTKGAMGRMASGAARS